MGIKELRELFGLSHSSVYYILAQQGYHQVRSGYRKGKIPEATRKQILQEYKEGALVTDLSNKYNVTCNAIYHHLDRHGLRIKKEYLLKKDAVVATDSTHKDFVPPQLEPAMIKDPAQAAYESLITPGKDLKDLKPPYLMAMPHKPTSQDKAPFGTQILDLNERQLYVQMNHDTENPLWVPIQPERKGILTRVKGWFTK